MRYRSLAFLEQIPEDERRSILLRLCKEERVAQDISKFLEKLLVIFHDGARSRQSLRRDLCRLRKSYQQLREAVKRGPTEVLNWAADEMRNPLELCLHDSTGGMWLQNSSNSMRKVLCCLASPRQYFENTPLVDSDYIETVYKVKLVFGQEGSDEIDTVHRFKRINDQERLEMVKLTGRLRERFCKAMQYHPSGESLLADFAPWETMESPRWQDEMSDDNMQAFMAYVFILLSFWDGPFPTYWDGTTFKRWTEPEIPFSKEIQMMAMSAAKILRMIIGRVAEELKWFKGPRSETLAGLDYQRMKIEDFAEIVNHIYSYYNPFIEVEEDEITARYLPAVESGDIFEEPRVDISELLERHKETTVELA